MCGVLKLNLEDINLKAEHVDEHTGEELPLHFIV